MIGVIKWPAQSPDHNLIEAFWIVMETQLGETQGRVGDIATLKQVLKVVWKEIGEEWLSSLIKGILAWLQAVIDAQGRAMPYYK